MPVSRRFFLISAAGGVAALGAGAWTFTRTPTAAIAPWSLDDARTAEDPRVRALAHAVLSANPHNRQPWLIALEGDDAAVIYADPGRLLPVTDPFSRQIVIGFGCFLETLAIAATQDGLAADITAFPEGADPTALDDRPIARVVFRPGAPLDPLAAEIPRRRTVKEPYALDPAPAPAALAQIAEAARGPGIAADTTAEAQTMAAIRDLMWRGHEREALTPAALQESVDLMRIGRREIEANPDGIDLSGLFLEGLSLIGALSREQIADPDSQAFAQGMEMYRSLLAATPAAIWLASDSTGRGAEIAAGRAWTRAHLTATALGLSLHPISQTLQEYPEMADLYAEAQRLFGAPEGGVIQMLGRVGAPPVATPSPRWPLSTRLLQRGA